MKKESILRRVPAILVALIILYLSSRSTLPMPLPPVLGMDKLAHFAAFAVLSFFACFWISAESWSRRPLFFFFAVVVAVSFYGILDEFHQSFVPNRIPSAADWVADTLGAAFGAFVFRRIVRRAGKFRQSELYESWMEVIMSGRLSISDDNAPFKVFRILWRGMCFQPMNCGKSSI